MVALRKNPEYAKAWRATHKKEISEYNKQYRADRKDYFKRYYETHREYFINYGRQRRLQNPEKVKLIERRSHWGSKGINPDTALALFRSSNQCAICHTVLTESSKFLDHNHETGVARGILCMKCNSMLGLAHENKEILKSAIEYLDKNGGLEQTD